MARRPTILYAGTYERDYPRNQQLIRLLRRCGCNVDEIHEPFWEQIRDKPSGFAASGRAILLGLRLLLIYLKLTGRVITRLRTADAMMVGYIGQIDMILLGSLARIARVPVLFNPLVTLTDTIVEDRHLTSSRSILGNAIWCLDWISLKLASCVLADTEENVNYIHETFEVPRSRLHTLHVGADEELFRPAHVSHSLSNELHVLFYGKMIPLHGIGTILEAAARLHDEGDTDITFEIIGSGQEEQLVTAFKRERPEIPLAHWPWVAYSRLPQRIASADVALGIFGESDKAARVVPNKVFQAMAAGAPIITRDSAAVRNILRDGDSALLIPAGDPHALVCAIRTMRDPNLRTKLGTRARCSFERHASDEVLARQLHDVLGSVLPELPELYPAGRCS